MLLEESSIRAIFSEPSKRWCSRPALTRDTERAMSQADLPYITEPLFSNQYAAGFFDGEGCVSITYSKRRPWKSDPSKRILCFRMVVLIANTDRGIVELFRSRFGGSIDSSNAGHPDYHKTCFSWKLTGAELQLSFLRAIRPFTLVKGPRIDIGMDYLKTVGSGPGKRISQENWNLRIDCYNRLRVLNKRGNDKVHLQPPPDIPHRGNTIGRPTEAGRLRAARKAAHG